MKKLADEITDNFADGMVAQRCVLRRSPIDGYLLIDSRTNCAVQMTTCQTAQRSQKTATSNDLAIVTASRNSAGSATTAKGSAAQ